MNTPNVTLNETGPNGRPLWQWRAQRASALVLAICVLIHLGTMIYAVRGGLSAVEILARTQGNVPVGLFYLVFVAAAAVHAPIGLMRIAEEWLGWQGSSLRNTAWLFGLLLLILGASAVFGLTVRAG